ncbi:unnamed protein product, partial [Hapterophycus canaliculatus]
GDYNTEEKSWWAGVGAAKFSRGLRKTVFDGECAPNDKQPGPGEYNPKLEPRYHLEMPGSAPFMSGVPKDGVRLQTGPGPGQYVHCRPLGANTSVGNVPNFSSCAQRGAWLRSDECPYSEPESGNIPGPGAYCSLQDNSSFNKTAARTLTDETIGFSSTGRRTVPGLDSQSAAMPGPGQYDVDVHSIAGALKHRSRIGRKGVFGSSGERFRIRNQTGGNVHKSPMQLWDQAKVLKRVVVLRPAPKSSSCFKSETGRFRSQSASAMSSATPYVRKDSFDDIVERGAKTKSKPFLSTTDRREGGAFEVVEMGSTSPGPGAYNLVISKTAVAAPRSRVQARPRLPQGPRFEMSLCESNVGPGSHDISRSLIKKTFNVTFGGACCPAGASRVVHHRACFARKTEHARKLSSGPPLHPAPE